MTGEEKAIAVAVVLVLIFVLLYVNGCGAVKPQEPEPHFSQTQQLGLAAAEIATLARNAGDYYRSGYMTRPTYDNVLDSLTDALNAIKRSTHALAIDKPILVRTNSSLARSIIDYVQGVLYRQAISGIPKPS